MNSKMRTVRDRYSNTIRVLVARPRSRVNRYLDREVEYPTRSSGTGEFRIYSATIA